MRILADSPFLLADHEEQPVERFLRDVVVEVRVFPFHQSERRSLFGVLVVLLREAQLLGRALHDRKKALAQLILGAAAEVLGARRLAALQDVLCVLHRHLADRVDEQRSRLQHRGFRGAVQRDNELVGVPSHAEAPHQLFGALQGLGERNFDLRIGEKAVAAPEIGRRGRGALLQRRFQARRRLLAGDALQLG